MTKTDVSTSSIHKLEQFTPVRAVFNMLIVRIFDVDSFHALLAAAFNKLFNINELMVFGLPIIFNPVMLIPFLTVPLVCYSSAKSRTSG